MAPLPFSQLKNATPTNGYSHRGATLWLTLFLTIGAGVVTVSRGAEEQEKTGAETTESWKENAKSAPGRTGASPAPSAPSAPTILTPNSATKLPLPEPFKVALDIGHTPKKGGAMSSRGVFEYEFNRRLVQEISAKLQFSRTVQSFVVNAEGKEITLPKRVEQASQHGADLFLAIHHDSVKESYLKKWEVDGQTRNYCDDFHGFGLFISAKNPKALESLTFANAVGNALLRAGFSPSLHHAEQEHRVVIDKEKAIYLFDDLIVLKAAKIPALLLECGVIVNRDEERNLNDPKYRSRLVEAITSGLESLAGPAAR